MFDRYRDDQGWTQYLAVHRHGGVDIGLGSLSYEVRDDRIFPLRRIVGIIWCAAALQVELIDRHSVSGPWELTLALCRTKGATLGMFSEGWAEPYQGFHREFPTCIEDHLFIRMEIGEVFDPETYAIEAGDRIENAFGSTRRRHLAHRGEYEGRFDPRFGM
jgi:hypothetical protein